MDGKISHRMTYGLNWIVEINARGFLWNKNPLARLIVG